MATIATLPLNSGTTNETNTLSVNTSFNTSPSSLSRQQSFSVASDEGFPELQDTKYHAEVGKGVMQAAKAANQTAVTVQRNIWANENPHPAVVIGVSAAVVCLVCLAFYVFRPAPLTGEWYDSKGERYYFKQNGKKVIVTSKGQTKHATFIENIFKLDDNTGVYDFHGVIRSVNGVSFYKTMQ